MPDAPHGDGQGGPPDQSGGPLLAIRGLTKSFGGARALDRVDLDIGRGEFVALLGPNGAGKSTLIKILAGVHRADAGEIRLDGERVSSLKNHRAVAFLHQDFGLVGSMTVLENLRLGSPPLRHLGVLLDRRTERVMAERALERVGLGQFIDAQVRLLSPGERALVALARTFDTGASLFVIDEATAKLSAGESRRVTERLHAATEAGGTVIFVTHRLAEVAESADRIVVLVDGKKASDMSFDGAEEDVLDLLLSGYHRASPDPGDGSGGRPAPMAPGEELIRLERASCGVVGPIDLAIHRGEAVGLTGLVGSGLHEIGYMAYGSSQLDSGMVTKPSGLRIALVPPQRDMQAALGELAVLPHLTISSLPRWRNRFGLLRTSAERAAARAAVARLGVVPSDPGARFKSLSGGNQQKVVFGRALLREPELYVLCEPTQGVDVRTRQEIYELIREMKASGAGVLVLSPDPEDIFAVCDQVGVVSDGKLGALTPASALTREELADVV